jgi:hypothetical protein
MNAQSAMYLEFHFLKGKLEAGKTLVIELLIQRVTNAYFTDNFS